MSSVREALQELVACKDLHKAYAKAFATAIKSHADADYAELSRIETEMARREQPAWATARAVLADVSHLAAESQAAGSSKPIAVEVESQKENMSPLVYGPDELYPMPIPAAQAQGADTDIHDVPHPNPRIPLDLKSDPALLAQLKSVAQEPPAPPDDLVRKLHEVAKVRTGPYADMLDEAADALEAQRGEIARIKEWGDHLLRKAVDAKTLKREAERELAAARDLAAQLSLDAKRYRWLRQFPTDTQQFGRRYWDDELDAAIDTLRAALKDAP